MNLSIITTCKGRLHHLKQTLPLMVDQQSTDRDNMEVIVVDYGDPDKCSEVLQEAFPQVTFVRVLDGTDTFSPSRARNIGGRIATGRYLGFVDGDVKLNTYWSTSCMRKQHVGIGSEAIGPLLAIPDSKDKEITGTCMIDAELYRTIRGYGEDLTDWGYQDHDLYNRAMLAGAFKCAYPAQFVEAIPNTDEERFGFYADRRKMYTGNRNKKISKRRINANPDGYGIAKVEILRYGQPPKKLDLKPQTS